MTRETFEGAALRGEQEAQDERKGSLTQQLWRAARGARKALVASLDAQLAQPGFPDVAAGYASLCAYVEQIAGIVDQASPKPEPAKHRCGHVASPGGVDPAGIREPLRSHLAKQDCPECRKGVRT